MSAVFIMLQSLFTNLITTGLLFFVYILVIVGVLQHLLITRKYKWQTKLLTVWARFAMNDSISHDINLTNMTSRELMTTVSTHQASYTKVEHLIKTSIKPNLHTVSSTPVKNSTIKKIELKTLSVTSLEKKPRLFLCTGIMGRLGNHLFEFASGYGVAAKKNMISVIRRKGSVDSVFELKNDSHLLLSSDRKECEHVPTRYERWCSRYDPQLENFTVNSNMWIGWGLQSWKYFNDSYQSLRKQMTFRKHIRDKATQIQDRTLKKFNFTSRSDVTFVGIHVRRGDMLTDPLGYDVATPEYISHAVAFFKNDTNTIFIVCSLDLTWSQKHIPKNVRVEYSVGNARDVDLALLASSDHMIQTVGTFGWWAGWLNNGKVIYYKWPAKEKGRLRGTFSSDYSDFFMPHWIGM